MVILILDIPPLNKSYNFKINTPVGVAGIRGTRFQINIPKLNTSNINLIVTEGIVDFKFGSNKEVSITYGEKMISSGDKEEAIQEEISLIDNNIDNMDIPSIELTSDYKSISHYIKYYKTKNPVLINVFMLKK